MNSISFEIGPDLSEEIGRNAANAGMTGSAWIASRLAHWLETDRYIDQLEAVAASLKTTIDETFPE